MSDAGKNIDEALRTAHQLTQRGQLDAAARVIADIRSVIEIANHPRVAVQTMVIEGCVAAYRGHWEESRDRLERARALAASLADRDSELLASAWLSYIAFISSDFDACVSLAGCVIEEHAAASDFALFRASAMVVLLLHLAGRTDEAEAWQRYTKRKAESLHQTATSSVIIFDIAAMRASSHRFDHRSLLGAVSSLNNLDLVFARSAKNFDEIGSVSVMPALHLLLEAQILNSIGRYGEAMPLLDKALAAPHSLPSVAINQAKLERLWAVANINTNIDASARPEEWQSEISQLIDDDDVAVYSARASRALKAAGYLDEAKDFESRAEVAARQFLEVRETLWKKLQSVHDMLPKLMPT